MAALKRSSAQMVAEARARIEELDSESAIALHGAPDVVFVDLRDDQAATFSAKNCGSLQD